MNLKLKDSDYFSHDFNSRNDFKVLFLRQQLGMEGYGIFWYVIESLAESGGYLPVKIIPFLAKQMEVTEVKVKAVILSFDLFKINGENFCSERLLKHFELKNLLIESGRKGAEKRWKQRFLSPPNSPPNSPPLAVKEKKEKEIKEIKEIKEKKENENNFLIDKQDALKILEDEMLIDSIQKYIDSSLNIDSKRNDIIKYFKELIIRDEHTFPKNRNEFISHSKNFIRIKFEKDKSKNNTEEKRVYVMGKKPILPE